VVAVIIIKGVPFLLPLQIFHSIKKAKLNCPIYSKILNYLDNATSKLKVVGPLSTIEFNQNIHYKSAHFYDVTLI
jgi:hypothetical protein